MLMICLVFGLLLRITVFAALAHTFICAWHSALKAFTVFFKAPWLLAMAAFWMKACGFLNFRLECMRVSFHDRLHGFLSFWIPFFIAAVTAIAVGTAANTKIETIAVEFETFRLFAVARGSSALSAFFISHEESSELLVRPECRYWLLLNSLFQARVKDRLPHSWVFQVRSRHHRGAMISQMPEGGTMEQARPFRCLEFVIILWIMVVVWLAVVRVKLPH